MDAYVLANMTPPRYLTSPLLQATVWCMGDNRTRLTSMDRVRASVLHKESWPIADSVHSANAARTSSNEVPSPATRADGAWSA